MALRILRGPLLYVQGPEALLQMGEQLQLLGIRNPLILISPSAKKAVASTVARGLKGSGIKHAFIDFGGECTFKEIEVVKKACLKGGHDAIVNCGGGKTIDTGRAAATSSALNIQKLPPELLPDFGANVMCINVPTVATTDASTSAASLVYTAEGTVEATLRFPTNPTMVLVDTAVIARSPVRLLVAGMGDALATHFEADMCHRTSSKTSSGALSTRSARALARLCFDVLMDYGVQAKAEAESGVPGPAMEAVVEANVLLSGLGFENCGLSAAHAIGDAFHRIPRSFRKPQYHGELVAFGTLTQLQLEARRPRFLHKIVTFCKGVGLPVTFEGLTLQGLTDGLLEVVAEAASRSILMRSMSGASKERVEGRFCSCGDRSSGICRRLGPFRLCT